MPTFVRTLLCLTLLVSQFTLFAQNGPPTIEQVRGYMNQAAERTKTSLVAVFKTEARNVWSGADSIPIQIYYPSDQRNLPILYNVHGGRSSCTP